MRKVYFNVQAGNVIVKVAVEKTYDCEHLFSAAYAGVSKMQGWEGLTSAHIFFRKEVYSGKWAFAVIDGDKEHIVTVTKTTKKA